MASNYYVVLLYTKNLFLTRVVLDSRELDMLLLLKHVENEENKHTHT